LYKLTSTQIKEELLKLDNWNFKNNLLYKVYTLSSFMDVMSFSNLVSDKSEQIDHHPKMIIDYNTIISIKINLVSFEVIKNFFKNTKIIYKKDKYKIEILIFT